MFSEQHHKEPMLFGGQQLNSPFVCLEMRSNSVIDSQMERSGRESNPQNPVQSSRFIRSLGLADAQPLHRIFPVNLTAKVLVCYIL